ncbi:hypothetical protein BGZ65_007895 [Modicella reniformis]|uniref:DDE-1 domain-containing protein n=1 Tax=Modicella reniformis TaxID=1440133 RepID=A0A9P6MFD7_9FUNG|nr:hypothetical protein BGZ65_007895 [Modicella reniformis]
MMKPHVTMRGIFDSNFEYPNFRSFQNRRSILIHPDVEDRVISSLKEWLTKFDGGLNRPIVLFLDQVVWDTLTSDPGSLNESQQQLEFAPMGAIKHSQSFEASLRNITIVKVPTPFASCLPMPVGLAKAFKRNYLRSYLEKYGQAGSMFKSETYLEMIRHAWNGVQRSTVQHSFEKILGPTSQFPMDPLKSSQVDPIQPASEKLRNYGIIYSGPSSRNFESEDMRFKRNGS